MSQVIRNMRSIGLDLRRWIETGLLRIWAARPTAFGLETHLAILARLIEEFAPSVAVLDGIVSLTQWALGAPGHLDGDPADRPPQGEGDHHDGDHPGARERDEQVGISSLVDTWLLLRNVETDGERNRLLYVLKSRGMAHSNQVREFVLTDHGAELVDVYVGPAGVVTGSARLAQEARERGAELQQDEDLMRRERELRRGIMEGEAQLVALQDELAAQRAEIERIEKGEQQQAADADAARSAMAARRWADPVPRDEGGQR